MGRIHIVRHSILLVFALAFALAEARAQQGEAGGTVPEMTYAAQAWSPGDRDTFYKIGRAHV